MTHHRIFAGIALALGLASAAWSQAPAVRFELVADPVFQPTRITHARDGSGRLFVVSQFGEIRVVEGGRVLPEPFLDIRDKVTCCSENGLLGLAFHPDYASNGRFFILYSGEEGTTILSRLLVSENSPNLADPGSEEVLLTIPQPGPSHQGGDIEFGPDGMLYVAVGDGGGRQAEAQSLRSLFGAILRVDVDGPSGYAVPPDNPFVQVPSARGEIFAYGFRNPWRLSFDRRTGDIFVGDVGAEAYEEIDFVPAGTGAGGNYGWNIFEGRRCAASDRVCENASLVPPIFDYAHASDDSGFPCGGSVIGGYRYRGVSSPSLDGLYFFGDFCTRSVSALAETASGWERVGRWDFGAVTTFGEDEAGEIYVADFDTGRIFRIVADPFAPSLSRASTSILATGGAGERVILAGENFTPASEARWNGAPRPTTYLGPTRLAVRLLAGDLAEPGVGLIDVSTPPPGGGLSASIELEVASSSGMAPAIADGGVVDAASFLPDRALAPGSIVSIFGDDLGLAEEAAAITPLSSPLGGATVEFVGVAAPLFFVSPNQINAQIPWEAAGLTAADLAVRLGDVFSESAPIALAPFTPGVFSFNGRGTGQAAAVIAADPPALAAPAGTTDDARPALPGEIVLFFVNGLGAVENPPATGEPASTEALSPTLAAPTVAIGGESAEVHFAGLAPGFVGLYQLNVEVPAEAESADAAPVRVEVGGVAAAETTIAVERP